MPRGKKSKARAREKRCQVLEKAQELKDAQVTAAEQDKTSSDSVHASEDAVPKSGEAGLPQKSQGAPATTATGTSVTPKKAGKGAKGRKDSANSAKALLPKKSPKNDLLSKKVEVLVEFMLGKFKQQKHVKKGEMLKVINRRFKEQLPEIFEKASCRLDVVFGLELKEVRPNGQSYIIVNKLDMQDDGSKSSKLGLPTRGILTPLLSIIHLNGMRASEEDIWSFLNVLGIHDGIPHLIFGNVRKLITEELVQEKYLEYRQVPGSDPPCYEFLWGSRAHIDVNTKKVMAFLNKVSESVPKDSPPAYEELFKEEEEKAQATGTPGAHTKAKVKGRAKMKASRPTG